MKKWSFSFDPPSIPTQFYLICVAASDVWCLPNNEGCFLSTACIPLITSMDNSSAFNWITDVVIIINGAWLDYIFGQGTFVYEYFCFLYAFLVPSKVSSLFWTSLFTVMFEQENYVLIYSPSHRSKPVWLSSEEHRVVDAIHKINSTFSKSL